MLLLPIIHLNVDISCCRVSSSRKIGHSLHQIRGVCDDPFLSSLFRYFLVYLMESWRRLLILSHIFLTLLISSICVLCALRSLLMMVIIVYYMTSFLGLRTTRMKFKYNNKTLQKFHVLDSNFSFLKDDPWYFGMWQKVNHTRVCVFFL